MASLIAQDAELELYVTRYTGADRTRYQITRRDGQPGPNRITLTAGQVIGLAAALADLRERGFSTDQETCSHRCTQGRHCGGCGCPGCGYSAD